jgi:hypothetical protein
VDWSVYWYCALELRPPIWIAGGFWMNGADARHRAELLPERLHQRAELELALAARPELEQQGAVVRGGARDRRRRPTTSCSRCPESPSIAFISSCWRAAMAGNEMSAGPRC